MEVMNYLRFVRRWLWLVVLAAVVAGSVAFVNARTQPAVYQANVTLQLGDYLGLANPNSSQITNAAALSQTYLTILRTNTVLETVVTNLKLPFGGGTLAGLFNGRLIQGTSFLVLSVVYTDPVIAADVANELANQLVLNSPTELSRDQQEQLGVLQNEIRQLQTQLQTARDEYKTVDTALRDSKESQDVDIAILLQRKDELGADINTIQTNLAMMSTTAFYLRQTGTTNFVRVVDRARIPGGAANANPVTSTLFAAGVASLFALGMGIVLEYFNDSLRSPDEINQLLSAPVLGAVPPFGSRRTYKDKLVTWFQPRSTVAEAYRSTRVNVLARDMDAVGTRLYAVTSPGPGEGKTTTSANMAVIFALTGMRVLLIDMDLRRPAVHQIFNLPNTLGLSNIWSRETPGRDGVNAGRADITTAPSLWQTIRLYRSAITQHTEIPNLHVITSGITPANPAELLDTPQTHELFSQLITDDEYDIVILDTPPMLAVADTSIILGVTNAKTLMVVESRRTRRGAALRTAQNLTSFARPLLGVIVNRVRLQDYSGDYRYYYGYSQYGEPARTRLKAGTEDPQSV